MAITPGVTRYDLIVLGSGPTGEKGAVQAAYFGKKVVVVERQQLIGGARVTSCALPSKALRETALYLSGYRQREMYGVHCGIKKDVKIGDLLCRNDPVVRAEVDRVVRNLARHRVTLLSGEASFVDPHTIHVRAPVGPDGQAAALDERIAADTILLATGSSPYRPPGVPFEDPDIHDSDEILEMRDIPKSLIVVGGGVIGCEYASMFAPLGVRVTLVEGGDRLLSFADGEVSAALATSFRRLGIDVRFGAKAERVGRDGGNDKGGIVVGLSGGTTLRADQVLYCAGRSGNTEALDLAAAGLAADPRGRLVVNENYQTAVPHIYAAGDVIGFPALASTGMEQARIAMCHAFDLKYKTKLSPILPLGIYTIPEFSMVGETEETAKEKGLRFEVGRAYYRDNARGQLSGDIDGLLKLVFSPADKKLLGVHVVGERATEIVHIGSSCMQFGGTIDSFIDAVYNYPTLSELYKYAAYDGLGRLAARTDAG